MFIFKLIINILILLTLTCCHKKIDDTWNVISVWLPPDVTPKYYEGNSAFYLLLQTHEPIFRIGENNEITSNILSKWSRSEDYRKFLLCIKKDQQFDKEIIFTPNELAKSLTLMKKKHSDIKININNDCVTVTFQQEVQSFFDQLTSLEFAPTTKEPSTNFELGLGPFKTIVKNNKKIYLKRKQATADGFNYIEMTQLSDLNEYTETLHNIEDFNLIPPEKIPNWVKSEYNEYPASLLKVYGLVINISDKNIRNSIFNCLKVERFQKIYFPNEKNPIFISSIIPFGISGAIVGKITQNCNNSNKLMKKISLTFANWKPDLQSDLNRLFDELFIKSNIVINTKNYDPTDLGKLLMNKNHNYDLMVVALDTTSAKYDSFFDPILDENKKFHSVKLQLPLKLYSDIKKNKYSNYDISKVQKLNKFIIDQEVFLPIIQQTRNYYFPKDINSISFGKNFLGYLEIRNLKR